MVLPGYTYVPYESVEDHIHLGVVPPDGGDPTGFGDHGEPPYRIPHVERSPFWETLAEFNRAWDGTPYNHVLKDDSANPLVFTGIKYETRVSPETLDLLIHLLKRELYVVDSLHCPDNTDHTPYVKKMLFDDLAYEEHLEPLLNYQIVTLSMLDMNTVETIE